MVFYRTCFFGRVKGWEAVARFLGSSFDQDLQFDLEAGSFKFSNIANRLLAPQKSLCLGVYCW